MMRNSLRTRSSGNYTLMNRPALQWGVFIAVLIAFLPLEALAQGATTSTCASGMKLAYVEPGREMIENVFAVLQAFMNRIGAGIYLNITNTQSFQNIVAAIASLYICVYGAMVTMHLVSHSTAEVATRLVRVSIFYVLLAWGVNGYIWFDKYVVTFFLGGMNELINYVTAASGATVVPYIANPSVPAGNQSVTTFLAAYTAMPLNPTAVSVVFNPMNQIFTPKYLIAILTLWFMKGAGPIMALALLWGFVQFAKMLFGAVVSYTTSIVGLTFLFGFAPIFILCLLFQRTRTIFMGWLSQVIAFSIKPVLLFAFLSFFCSMIANVLQQMFIGVDFCMEKLVSVSGTPIDITWWRPVMLEEDAAGNIYRTSYPGDWPLPPAINMVNVFFFVVLSHLGTTFNSYVSGMSDRIADAVSPASGAGSSIQGILNSGALSKRGTGTKGDGMFGAYGTQTARNITDPTTIARGSSPLGFGGTGSGPGGKII